MKKYKCEDCGYEVDSKQSYCAHRKHCQMKGKIGNVSELALKVLRHRARWKAILVEHLGGKCKYCGYDKCLRSLDFHHRKSEEKKFGISAAIARHRGVEELVKEAEKCDLVCSNCHGEIHTGLIEG